MKNIVKKHLTYLIFVVVILFAILSINKCFVTALENNYVLDTNAVQKKFYKYGVFSTAGLVIRNDELIIDSNKINIISAPDLTVTGNQIVRVSYANKEFSYNIEVIDNHPGDVITLKDGSRWNFIQRENNNITLISEDLLKKENDTLVFNYDDTEAYKANFNEANDILQNNFKPAFLESLGVENNSSISISLPDANIISKIGEVEWKDSQINTVSINNLTKVFLLSNESYWTVNEYKGPLNLGNVRCSKPCVWAMKDAYITKYYKTSSVGIRPQLTLTSELLEKIFVSQSDFLPFVTSANYYVYDILNDKTLFSKKGVTKYKNDDIDTIYPASMTKMATVIYSIERMKEKGIVLDDKVTIHRCIDKFLETYSGVAAAGFKSGEEVTYRDLFYGALFSSGWDATMQLSISLYYDNTPQVNELTACANLDRPFAQEMTEFVKTKILKDSNSKTNFINASGLFNEANVAEVKDIAKILNYSINNSTFREIITSPSYTTSTGLNLTAPIAILRMFPYYKGSKGGNTSNGKTGDQYIHSGYNLASYMQSLDKSYIVVSASDFSKVSMGLNQFNIYQWLYPGSITITPYQSTISFNSNGGSKVNDIFQAHGTNIELFAPIKEGYTFEGWYEDSNLSIKFEKTTMPNVDMILYAKWNKIETLKNILESKGYIVSDVFVTKFTLGESISSIKSRIGNDVIINTNNNIISTGAVFKKNSESYSAVIKGDVNGDGKISSLDYVKIKNHIMETKLITGDVYINAADYNSDDKISSLDYVKVKNHIMNNN